MSFYTNGNTTAATSINSDGDVKANSFVSNLPNIYFGTTGSQTCSAGGVVQFTANTVNPQGLYTPSSHTFTPQFKCYVEVFASMVQVSSGSVAVNLFVYKNGGNTNIDLLWVGPGGTNNINPSGSGRTVLLCNAGEALTIRSKYACSISSGNVMYKILETNI